MGQRQQLINSAAGKRHSANFERHQMAWKALRFFQETVKVEAAMWERFQTMPVEAKRALAAFYGTVDDYTLFMWICKFWAVCISPPGKMESATNGP